MLCYDKPGRTYFVASTTPDDAVSSAEVRVNGKPAGIRVSPPWNFDISKLVKAGENRIEVLVCNTLANQYLTIPTGYRGQSTSGLLGPVTVTMRE